MSGLVDETTGTATGNFEYGPFGENIRVTPNANNQSPFRFSTNYTDDESDFLYYGFRYYNPAAGRWLSRDPIQERGGMNLYSFPGDDLVNSLDPFGTEKGPPSFKIKLETNHNRTTAIIAFDSGYDARGCILCEKPKLVQIVITFERGLLRWILRHGGWQLDTDKASSPWYPYQFEQRGFVQITDRPGTRAWDPTTWVWGAIQSFEDCAVCTDDGPGKYWIIGCASWGHDVGGIGASTNWGEGERLRPVSPSSEFLRLFPKNLLRP